MNRTKTWASALGASLLGVGAMLAMAPQAQALSTERGTWDEVRTALSNNHKTCMGTRNDGGPAKSAVLWECNGNGDQRWSFVKVGSNSEGPIYKVVNQLDECLATYGGATGQGSGVIVWGCNGARDQQWQVKTLTNSGWGQQRMSEICQIASGHCISSPGGATDWGTKLIIWKFNGALDQQWF
ncbi:RICIN domain-containing protein [Streptomyces sp. NPDC056402]|uniref:RICIN domain-containing protein n=1 Tax=Streptomyces sp. NPDC056402 TaxID=3345810 RepID=UPI0035D820E1